MYGYPAGNFAAITVLVLGYQHHAMRAQVIMCLQNVWDPLLQSRAVCLFEMSFKVLIFTFFATMSLKHGFQFGVELWLAATSRPDGARGNTHHMPAVLPRVC